MLDLTTLGVRRETNKTLDGERDVATSVASILFGLCDDAGT